MPTTTRRATKKATAKKTTKANDKIRRVARTIADLEQADVLTSSHVAEAVQYRLLDRIL